MKSCLKYILIIICAGFSTGAFGQQDPQFTQYMYNTLSVNPAYAGSRGNLSVLGLYRNQWVGLNGAPTSQTLNVDGPVGKNVGLGVVLVHDELGPSNDTFIDANFSYTIRLDGDENKRLSFGIKGGGRLLNVDFSEGLFQDQTDVAFQNNIDNDFFPTIGAGIYYHTNKGYLGLAVPNFFNEDQYDGSERRIVTERLHYFLIGGRVFELNQDVLFKPAFFVKWVPGAPIIADVSANFLLKDVLTLGLAYRWDDSFAGLIGIDISQKLHIGYAYDFTTTELRDFNNGTHEIFLRFELRSLAKKLKSPRFY